MIKHTYNWSSQKKGERENNGEEIFEEIRVPKFSKLMKSINSQIQNKLNNLQVI